MEKFGDDFYIHFIYSHDQKVTYYARVTTSRDRAGKFNEFKAAIYGDLAISQRAYEAVFAGTNQVKLEHTGNVAPKYQSYSAGHLTQYTSYINMSVDNFAVNSYAVWPTIS